MRKGTSLCDTSSKPYSRIIWTQRGRRNSSSSNQLIRCTQCNDHTEGVVSFTRPHQAKEKQRGRNLAKASLGGIACGHARHPPTHSPTHPPTQGHGPWGRSVMHQGSHCRNSPSCSQSHAGTHARSLAPTHTHARTHARTEEVRASADHTGAFPSGPSVKPPSQRLLSVYSSSHEYGDTLMN